MEGDELAICSWGEGIWGRQNCSERKRNSGRDRCKLIRNQLRAQCESGERRRRLETWMAGVFRNRLNFLWRPRLLTRQAADDLQPGFRLRSVVGTSDWH